MSNEWMALFWRAWPPVLAVVAYLAVMVEPVRPQSLHRPGRLLTLAFVLHALAIAASMGLWQSGEGIRLGFALALSVTMWCAMAVYLFDSGVQPGVRARRLAAALAATAVAVDVMYPGDLQILGGSWAERLAPVHWVFGLASYGLFAAAVAHALMLTRQDRQLRRAELSIQEDSGPMGGGSQAYSGLSLLALERLTFHFVLAGFVTLTLALVIGGLDTRHWRWDHKVILSLLAWAVFAGLLAGRHAMGWRGHRATRWLYAGALLLLLAYVGSRFVVQVLLQK